MVKKIFSVLKYLEKLEQNKLEYDEKKFSKKVDQLTDDEIYKIVFFNQMTVSIFDYCLTMLNQNPYNYLFGEKN